MLAPKKLPTHPADVLLGPGQRFNLGVQWSPEDQKGGMADTPGLGPSWDIPVIRWRAMASIAGKSVYRPQPEKSLAVAQVHGGISVVGIIVSQCGSAVDVGGETEGGWL